MRELQHDDEVREEAPSDGVDRRGFLGRMAALSAGAGALGVLAPKAMAAIPGSDAVVVDVRPEALADPVEATIAEAATLLRSKKLDPVDLVQAHVDRVQALDGTLKAFNAVVAEQALAKAKALRGTSPRSALAGMPLNIKDNYYTAGIETTANSTIYQGFVPDYDATCVARLTAAGGIVLGKGQMGPLATTRATLPNGTVTTVNAWTPGNPSYDPGGSSSGPATAVASRMAKSSIGTQTGGSITSPSNQQGLTGLKPTMGRTSLYGVIPLTYTRDHCGPIARDALDAAIMLTALAGADPHDPRTQGLPAPTDYITAAKPVKPTKTAAGPQVRFKTKLGVLPDYLTGNATTVALRQAFLDEMVKAGVTIVQIPFPDDWSTLTGTAFNNVRLPERSEPFMDVLRTDVTKFGVSLNSWIQGLFLTGDTYLKGQRMKQDLLQKSLEQIFDKCDVVTQTSNQPFDIIGLPEIAFPIGFTTSGGSAVPVGTILGAAPYAEDRLLAMAGAWQARTDFHTRRPPEPAAPTLRAARSAAATLRLTPEEVAETTA
ncbi:amidase [Conexibacter sp. SYSU D00693]|uniref:amidase n=1 Tax=Conexibacter sp. SYSU D00693 TaxID=2812560 RepID=UPI00196AABF6|nr:amidase [Conexibacter sp. SYSU D00693]